MHTLLFDSYSFNLREKKLFVQIQSDLSPSLTVSLLALLSNSLRLNYAIEKVASSLVSFITR